VGVTATVRSARWALTGGGALRALSQIGRLVDRVTSFTMQPDNFRVNLRYCQPLEQ
jgi:hypothetical protein